MLIILTALLSIAAAPLQDGYTLVVHKSMGFNNGSQIRGLFSAEVVGNMEAVQSVQFLADGQVFAELRSAPFKTSFQTTDFSAGWHTLSALVQSKDGSSFSTPERRFEFVTPETEAAFFRTYVFPFLIGVFLLVFIGIGFQYFSMRNRRPSTLPLGAERSYGLKGGGICPQCKRAFSLHWWSINLIGSVYDRCDFCGKWSLIRPASRAVLDAAIAAELAESRPEQPIREKSETDRLKDMLDDSRFSK
jgi:hypothetical protein